MIVKMQRRQGPMKMGADIGIMSRNVWGVTRNPQKLGRGAFRERLALSTLGFQTSSLWACERIYFCCFKPPPQGVILGYYSPKKLV